MLAELRDADGHGLPRYVERELAEYLRCGILAARATGSGRRSPAGSPTRSTTTSRSWRPPCSIS